MSDPTPKRGFGATLKRWFRPIANWPIVKEFSLFWGDLYRYYKLDIATGEAVTTGRSLHGDYKRSGRGMRNWLKIAIVAAVLFVIAACIYHAYYNPQVSRLLDLPMPVDAVTVKSLDLVDTSGGGGQIQQSATVNLTSRIVGQITKVNVNLGDIVSKDTVLYEVDPRVVESALIAAKQLVLTSQSAVQLAQSQDTGNETLKKQGLASDADTLTSGSALATARSNLAQAQEAEVNAELDLANSKVKSPVDGIILQRLINPQERVVTNETTMQIGDLDKVYFLAQIAEDKIASVQLGLNADVIFPAFPGDTFTGKVFFIDPKTNTSTRAFTAYIVMDNPNLELKPGLSGFARITKEKHVIAVPDSALVNPVGNNAAVFTITHDNHAVLRKVAFGMSTQGWTEIDSGIKEGDIVAAVGPLYLEDGDKVHYVLKGR